MDLEERETILSAQDKWLYLAFRKLVNLILFVLYSDPFAIYRLNNGRARFDIYRSQEVQLPELKLHRWQLVIRSSIGFLMSYLSIRYTISAALLITSSLLTKKYRSDLNEFESLQMNSTLSMELPENVAKALDSMSIYDESNLKRAVDLLGSPFSSLPGTAIMFDIYLAGTVLYIFIIFPRNHRNVRVDWAILRFMLDPLREIKRIDLIIKQYLEQISFESFNNKLVNEQFKQIFTFRPINTTPNWHRTLYKQSIVMMASITVWFILFDLIGFTYIYCLLKRRLCKLKNLSHCNYSDVFNIQHSIGFMELIIGWCGGIIVLESLLVKITVDMICQISMAKSVMKELINCRLVMNKTIDIAKRLHNNRYCDDRKQIQPANSVVGEMHLRASCEATRYTYVLRSKEQQLNVEISLLRSYVKVMVARDEIKRNAIDVTKSVESVIIIVGCAVGGIVVANFTAGYEAKLFSFMWYILVWTGSNQILFSCAYVYSRSIESEKIAWSILAELSAYRYLAAQTSELNSYHMGSGLLDLLAKKWCKLVGRYSLSDKGYSLNPYGFRVTYKRVLRINFLVISLYSLKELLWI